MDKYKIIKDSPQTKRIYEKAICKICGKMKTCVKYKYILLCPECINKYIKKD